MIPIHRWLGLLLLAAVPLLGCAGRPPPPPGTLPEHTEPSPGTPVRAELLPESCEAKVQSLPEVEERLAQADRVTVAGL